MAQRLLSAARRIVTRRGYNSLSINAVGDEADTHPSLVFYYFGSKAGLVAALVDTLVDDPSLAVRRELSSIPPGLERVRGLIEAQKRISARRPDFRLFYELVPQTLRDKKLRQRLADEYHAAREADARVYAETGAYEEADCVALATLGLALLDGLGLHLAIDPTRIDHERAYALWLQLVDEHLLRAATSADEPQQSQERPD
jgi:AcrR family transcriptional regulator